MSIRVVWLFVLSFAFSAFAETQVITDFNAHTSSAAAVQMAVGDQVTLPALPTGGTYELLNFNAFRLDEVDGTYTLTALKPGFTGVELAVGGNKTTAAFLCLPVAKGTGRVFILKEDGTKESLEWCRTDNWVQLGKEENDDWPSLPDDVAMAPVYSRGNTFLRIASDVSIGAFYYGRYSRTATGDTRIEGTANTTTNTLTFATSDGTPASIIHSGSATNHTDYFRFGYSYPILVTQTCDVEGDFGRLETTPGNPKTSANQRTDIYFESKTILEVPENLTFRIARTSAYRSGFGCYLVTFSSKSVLRGGGTVWHDGATHMAVREGADISGFTGRFVESGYGSAGYDRDGNFMFDNDSIRNATLEVAGFVVMNSQWNTTYDGAGVFRSGVNHGYGDRNKLIGNRLAGKCLLMNGGTVEILQECSGGWGEGALQLYQTERLEVDNGFSVVNVSGRDYDLSSTVSYPFVTFIADSLATTGRKGMLMFNEAYRSRSPTTSKANWDRAELGGFAAHAIGGTGDCATQTYPVIPWIISQNAGAGAFFAAVDSDGNIKPVPTNTTTLDEVEDAQLNAYTTSSSLALTADRTVNSIVINTPYLSTRLGDSRKLTVTSGGVIFSNAGTGIANGTVEFPNTAYIYPCKGSANNPVQIWANLVAPHGVAIGYPNSYMVLGGDQTGIDDELVLNAGTLYLGAKDGSEGTQIDVPVRVVSKSNLIVTKSGTLDTINLYIDGIRGFSGAITLPADAIETCNKLYINGESMPHGTYGATGSGADYIDDDHFVGTGVLSVSYDDLGWPIVSDLTVTLVEETSANFTVRVVPGSGASVCDVKPVVTVGGVTVTNAVVAQVNGESEISFTVSELEPGVSYEIRALAVNDVTTGGETLTFDVVSAPVEFTTVAVSYTPELLVDASSVRTTATTATVPWTLANRGYQCTLTSLSIEYGTEDGVFDRSFLIPLDTERGDVVTQMTGLVPDTVYHARIAAVNNRNVRGVSEVFTFTTLPTYSTQGAIDKFVGGDRVAVWTGNGSFNLPENATVRILAVGGGGAGGFYCGGGGGAGFVTEQTLELQAGTYTVTVGAGGVAVASQTEASGDGGESSIAFGGEVLISAPGGGAGGTYKESDICYGHDGGNGGGSATWGGNNSLREGGAPTARGGHSGGSTLLGDTNSAGGGGGAGADGGNAKRENNVVYGGNGGDGVISDITGDEIWYGGGGGGSTYSRDRNVADSSLYLNQPGKGGKGGGGDAAGGNLGVGTYLAVAASGIDGLGGGGGGGMRRDGQSVATTAPGGNGGSGAVIIRFANEVAEPMVEVSVEAVGTVAALRARVQALGANAETVTLKLAIPNAGEFISQPLAADGEFKASFTGLTPEAVYNWTLRAVNSTGAVLETSGSFIMPATRTLLAGGAVADDGDYRVHTFTENGSFRVPIGGIDVDILLVGGGGAGGYNRGGGGGAGGLIYKRGVHLEPGDYTVTVGAGGRPNTANATPGGNGGDSVLALGGVDILRAIGGGGGGNFNNTDNDAFGAAGGSGGGNARSRWNPMLGVEGQGNRGGPGLPNDNNFAGGGGGAGEPGGIPFVDRSREIGWSQGGKGGDGLEIDISGAFVWYAGGGGGGSHNNYNDGTWRYQIIAPGGLGGGGAGAGNVSGYNTGATDAKHAAESGVDGLGGGGGGGGSGDSNGAPVGGGAGGSGVVIVRYRSAETGRNPAVDIISAAADESCSAKISWRVLDVGSEASSVSVKAIYGLAADSMNLTQQLAEDGLATTEGALKGLVPGKTYYVAVVARNDQGAEARCGSVAKITVPELDEEISSAAVSEPGMWQAKFSGKMDWLSDIRSSTTCRREIGAVMAYIQGIPGVSGTWSYTSPIDGFVSEWAASTTFAYEGYAYFSANNDYFFVAGIDDFLLLKIDGKVLIRQEYKSSATYAIYRPNRTGWHKVEIRLGNVAEAAGYCTINQIGNWGLAFQCFTMGDKSWPGNWVTFRNNFTGLEVVRTAPPGRGFSVSEVRDSATGFAAKIAYAASDSDASIDALYACCGSVRGTGEVASWERVIPLNGELPATAGEFNAALTLSEVEQYVRFAIVKASGEVTWSETFIRDAVNIPTVANLSAGNIGGDTATITGKLVRPSGAATAVTLYYGPSSDTSSMSSAEMTFDGVNFSCDLTHLASNTRYYYYVVADNGRVSDTSEMWSFTTLGSASVSNFWVDNSDQRILHIHFDVGEVGAGGVVSAIIRGGLYSTKDNYVPSDIVAAANVTEAGEVVLDWDAGAAGYNFGDNLRLRLDWSNGSGSATFSGSSAVDIKLYDLHTYEWTGAGADNLWSNPDNWRDLSVGTDAIGYPAWGAKVQFPAGVNSTVRTDISAELMSFSVPSGTENARTGVTLLGSEDKVIGLRKADGKLITESVSMEVGDYTDFIFDEGAAMQQFNEAHLRPGINSHIALRNGSVWSPRGQVYAIKAGTVIEVESNSRFYPTSHTRLSGAGTRLVIDDGIVAIQGSNGGEMLALNSSDGATPGEDTCVIMRGTHPYLSAYAIHTHGNQQNGRIIFEVPVGGYREAPVRQFYIPSKGTVKFSSDTNNRKPVKLEISADSPAFSVAGTTQTDLVNWHSGFTTSGIVLPTAPEGTGVATAYRKVWATGNDDMLAATLTGRRDALPLSEPADAFTGRLRRYGPYEIRIYDDPNAASYFTATGDITADVLLVGGGGAGGYGHNEEPDWSGGGGGGAGGFLLKNNITIPAGTYRINVGSGGLSEPLMYYTRPVAGNGGSSKAFGLVAFGGGGGASSISPNGNAQNGANGGSGGGGYGSGNRPGGFAISGQGKAGGTAANNQAGGGGGAGSAGKNGNTTTSTGISGSPGEGGDGLSSDISGELVWYAGGGGAAAVTKNSCYGGAPGGKGGGGRGASRWCTTLADDGVDGLGGGGGGSTYNASRRMDDWLLANAAQAGGRGGNGTVIVRYRVDEAADAPYVAFRKVTSSNSADVSIEWDYIEPGTGAAVNGTAFTVYVGNSANDISTPALQIPAGQISATGVQTSVVIGLMPGRTYYARIVAENALGVKSPVDRADDVFTFTTKSERGVDRFAGLIQGSKAAIKALDFEAANAADAHVVPGAVMAGTASSWVCPDDGTVFSWAKSRTYAYSGYMWMEQGKTYRFMSEFYFWRYLTIEDVNVANADQEQVALHGTPYVPTRTGWHKIDLRMGTKNDARMGPLYGFTFGIGWTTDENFNSGSQYWQTPEGWNAFMDPGDGSLLRTCLPDTRELEVRGTMWNAARTVLTASVAASGSGAAVKVIACYGEDYGGDNVSAWANTVEGGVIGAEEAGLSVALSGLPAKGYLRFAGQILDENDEPTGEVVWSETVAISECVDVEAETPTITFDSVVAVDSCYADLQVTVLAVGSAIGDTCAVKAIVAESEEALENAPVRTLESQAYAGTSLFRLHGLIPNTTYYVVVFADNDAGECERSQVETFETPSINDGGVNSGSVGGLWQVKFKGGGKNGNPNYDKDWSLDIRSVPVGAGELDRRIERGTIMAFALQGENYDSVIPKFTSEIDGFQHNWYWNTQFAYAGYIYLH